MVGSSALFGLFHLGSPDVSPLSVTVIVLWGVLGGVAYALTGRLALSAGVHITWNLFEGNIFCYSVSGLSYPAEAVTLLSVEHTGPKLWTGGTFGPEGGLLGLLAVVVGIALVVAWTRLRHADAGLYTRLLVGRVPHGVHGRQMIRRRQT